MYLKNVQRYEGLSFEEYRKLPFYSNSYLKNAKYGVQQEIQITDNIDVGRLVDEILTSPENANISNKNYSIAKNISNEIKKQFGEILPKLKTQVSYTGILCYGGWELPIKGRPDYELKDYFVLDLKVTNSKNFKSVIDYLGYKNQLWLYRRFVNAKQSLLLYHSRPLKLTEIISIDVSQEINEFWYDSILNYGTYKN